MNLRRLLLFSILYVSLLSQALAQSPSATDQDSKEDWVYLENDALKLGLLRSHGGAIGYLADRSNNENELDHYDHGRLVQQSYYGNDDGSMWAKEPWRYNPVQGGDYQGHASQVIALDSTSTTARVETIPRHWASGELLKECKMSMDVDLQETIVHVHYRFEYHGKTSHGARHQETPAVFINAKLKKLLTYQGDRPWTNAPLTSRVPGWPNEYCKLDEAWAAYVNDQGEGIGIFVPGVTEATCYHFGRGKGECSYVAPLRTFALTEGLVFEYDAYLTLGDIETIRNRFRTLHEKNPNPKR